MSNQDDIEFITGKDWWREPNDNKDWHFLSSDADVNKLSNPGKISDIVPHALKEKIDPGKIAQNVRKEWTEKQKKKFERHELGLGCSDNKDLDKFLEDHKIKYRSGVHLEVDKVIGEGGFGVVYKAILIDGGPRVTVALKCVKTDDLKKFLEEWSIHAELLYSYEIVNVIGFATKVPKISDTQYKYIAVLEYANGGTLKNNLEQIYASKWKQKLYILYKIASGLKEIHQQGYAHLDIHDGNILINKVNNDGGEFTIDAKDDVWICDLGICQAIESSNKGNIYGNPAFMAPEAFNGTRNKHNDIYGFAMIMWELAHGVQPFSDDDDEVSLLALKVQLGTRPKIGVDIPSGYKDLMKQCWDGEPNNRPNADEVLLYLMRLIFAQSEVKPGIIENIKEFIAADENPPQAPNNAPQASNNTPQVSNNASSSSSSSQNSYLFPVTPKGSDDSS